MTSKALFLLFSFIFVSISFAQTANPIFGVLSSDESQFTAYEKDSTAHAVVLYEKGNNYFKVIKNRIWLIKDYHAKIKILDREGFDKGIISIPYYKGENSSEIVEGIRAISHNGNVRTGLRENNIYTNDVNERWSEKTFTFPNIKEGSVLEYKYRTRSPFFYNFNGWSFQSDIPKLYSEFNAEIPANYVYNRSLSGSLGLSTNESSIKQGCFHIEGYSKSADCEILKYAMTHIPAFEKEEYMLAASNYISRIDFELSQYHRLSGEIERYTKSWDDVDSEFKKDQDIGRQLTKKGFFEKNVPETLLTSGDDMTKAKNIYAFIQNHYTWNGKYGIYRDIRVKDAFDRGTGNIGEINISLINLLNAADIPTKLMMVSTREHGLPKKSHPVMSDFNYVVAKTIIDGKDYILDASDKLHPFGMLPFRCLNHYGRVMDFKNKSYWNNITVGEESRITVRGRATFNPEQNKIVGKFDEVSSGYDAIAKKRKFSNNTEDSYLEQKEKAIGGGFIFTSYDILEDRTNEKQVTERSEFELDNLLIDNTIYFDPFITKFFEKNPFLSQDRQFPVDFGYAKDYSFSLTVRLPDEYEAQQLPEDKVFVLPGKMGTLKFQTTFSNNQINMYYHLKLKSSYFLPEHYSGLKELFKYAIEIQNNSSITIKRKDV